MSAAFRQSMSFFVTLLMNFFRSCALVSGLFIKVAGFSNSYAWSRSYFSTRLWEAKWSSLLRTGSLSLYFFLYSQIGYMGLSSTSFRFCLAAIRLESIPTSCLSANSTIRSAVNSAPAGINISLTTFEFLMS